MLLQKLNLVDDHITATTNVLQNVPVDATPSRPGVTEEKEQVVLAFDVGDEENAGNWVRVSIPTPSEKFIHSHMLMVFIGKKVIHGCHWLAARFQHHNRLIPTQRCYRYPSKSLRCSKSTAAYTPSGGLSYRLHLWSYIIRAPQRVLWKENGSVIIVSRLHSFHACLCRGSELDRLVDLSLHCGRWRRRAAHGAWWHDRRRVSRTEESRTGCHAPRPHDQPGPHHWSYHFRIHLTFGLGMDVLVKLDSNKYRLAVSHITSW